MTEEQLLEEVWRKLNEVAPIEKPEPTEFSARQYADKFGIKVKEAEYRLRSLAEQGLLYRRRIGSRTYYGMMRK